MPLALSLEFWFLLQLATQLYQHGFGLHGGWSAQIDVTGVPNSKGNGNTLSALLELANSLEGHNKDVKTRFRILKRQTLRREN